MCMTAGDFFIIFFQTVQNLGAVHGAIQLARVAY